jgi:hypothetical protein
MSAERRTEFDDFCKHNRNNTDIHKWLLEKGYEIHFSSVCNWRQATFPTGQQAQILNQLGEVYDGLEGDRSLASVEGIALSLIRELTQLYRTAPNKLDKDVIKLFALLPAFLREARSAASQREQLSFVRDRAELVLAGGQRVADLLVQTFEGTSFEDSLREAITGVMLQLERESKNQ